MTKPILLTILVSAGALAQTATEAPPPPPPAADASATTAPADAPIAEDPGGRVRWGIGVGIGWHFPYSAFGMGLHGSVGYQVSNVFSAYLDIGTHFGVGLGATASSTGGSVSATGIGHLMVLAMAEAMFGNLFYVAGGGGIAYGGLATAGVGASTTGAAISTLTAGGVKPAFDLRLGLGFGKPKPDTHRRGGFNLGLDALLIIHPNALAVDVNGNSNGGSINVNGPTLVTVTPMLTLGYESR
ncbi:MAG: hypothetical protein U0228_21480 [Myxococcaceae bacterium]